MKNSTIQPALIGWIPRPDGQMLPVWHAPEAGDSQEAVQAFRRDLVAQIRAIGGIVADEQEVQA